MPPYPIQNLITVSGFKLNNPEVDVTPWSDTTLSGYISRCTRWMQNYCEVEGFATQSVTSERAPAAISTMGDLTIYPRIRPIQSVSAVRLVKGGFSTNLTLSGTSGQLYYQMPYPYTSIVYPSSYLAGAGTLMIGGSSQLVSLRGAGVFYEIDYTGGYATIPEDLQQACELVLRDYLNRRYNNLGADSVHQGSFGFSMMKDESMWILEAKEILDQGGYHRTVQGG